MIDQLALCVVLAAFHGGFFTIPLLLQALQSSLYIQFLEQVRRSSANNKKSLFLLFLKARS